MPPTTPNWKLVIEAVNALNGVASIPEIEAYFKEHFPPEKRANNVRYDATAITVNANSRIHYGAGKQIRRTDSGNQYDRLFRRADGRYELYQSEKHGIWEIAKNSQGNLYVQQFSEPMHGGITEERSAENEDYCIDTEFQSASSQFAMESHLRDYLAQNLKHIQGLPAQLELFTDESGIPGVEYRTGVGLIDILARDANGAFYVLELKVSRGSDAVIGQIMRYMGWIRDNLSNGHPVYGVVVTNGVSEKLKYAASEHPGIFLREYELSFSLRSPAKLAP
jgi:endonuclease